MNSKFFLNGGNFSPSSIESLKAWREAANYSNETELRVLSIPYAQPIVGQFDRISEVMADNVLSILTYLNQHKTLSLIHI